MAKRVDISKDEKPMVAGALGVVDSIAHLRDTSRHMLKIIFVMGAALTASVILNIGLIVTEKEPVYFGLNHDMTLLPMHSLAEPMVNDAALKSWASAAITDIFNMDFLNWRSRISSARQYFTDDAFKGFAQSLDKEGHIQTLNQYRSIMHGTPTAAPVVTASGVLKGVRTWDMEIPFTLNYETSEKTLASQRFFVKLRIRRVPTTEYPKGIAISQLTISSSSERFK